MTLMIVTNGTTGLRNGTTEVPGDQSGINLNGIGSSGVFHFRSSGLSESNAVSFSAIAPIGCQVSKDGSIWSSFVDYSVDEVNDTNIPCYIKRVSNPILGQNWTGVVCSPRVAAITTSSQNPQLSGSLIASTGTSGTVALSGLSATDLGEIDKFQYQKRITGAGSWDSAVDINVTDGSSVTMPVTNITSLTNEQSYDFQVRAVDAVGNPSAWSSTTTAMPYDTHQFTFSSLDLAAFGTVTGGGGSVSVSTDELVIDTIDAVSRYAVAYLKQPIPSATRTYTHKVKLSQLAAGVAEAKVLSVRDVNGVPYCGTNTIVNADHLIDVGLGYNGTNPYYKIVYYPTAGTPVYRWDGTAGSWITTGGNIVNTNLPLDTFVFIKLEVTSAQWRVTILDSTSTQRVQTPWVDWSSTRVANVAKLVTWGDPYDAYHAAIIKSNYFEVS
ncbi:fibronectin type III domain-containing protein [Candidatus Saccharibacteria bacterium]|nr:fibronectin type III domain-containing protein [Candidatus Saccharibacteria bacterium]